MDFAATLIGAALAVMGGILAQGMATRGESREASRERLSNFHAEARSAAVAANDALYRLIPDVAFAGGNNAQLAERLAAAEQGRLDADRQLLSVWLRSPPEAAKAGEAADTLRFALRKAINAARRAGEYGQLGKGAAARTASDLAWDAANAALDDLVYAIRELST